VILQFRRDAIATDLDDGMQVAVSGDLSFYTDDNYCSIMVEDVVAVGTGVYQQTYEQNKQRLADDGLLDATTKQPLPDYPQCIGLATSAESDAREDAVTSIQSQHPDVDISIEDTAVQGDAAGQSMMQAIGALDNDAQVDIIVLTRGGGADKHLRVFNDTALCRVIHGTTTPIVVGVGHEADRTLADEVADERVMTPTEVGEIVPHKQTLTDETDALADRLDTAYRRTVLPPSSTRQPQHWMTPTPTMVTNQRPQNPNRNRKNQPRRPMTDRHTARTSLANTFYASTSY
jgi:exodeoxyribonuclease VII large subunit